LVNRSIKLTCFYQLIFFFFQAEDGIRDFHVTGVQTCALPISTRSKQALRTPRPRSEHHDSAKNRRARSPFVPANPRYAPGAGDNARIRRYATEAQGAWPAAVRGHSLSGERPLCLYSTADLR